MNTRQIYNYIWKDPIVCNRVMAVIKPSCLQYLKPGEDDGIYILNTIEERSDLPVRRCGHWVVVCIEARHCPIGLLGGTSKGKSYKWYKIDIFDCLGNTIYDQYIEMFIKQFTITRRHNIFINTGYCGYYCLVYIYYKCRSYSHYYCLKLVGCISHIRNYCLNIYSAPLFTIN